MGGGSGSGSGASGLSDMCREGMMSLGQALHCARHSAVVAMFAAHQGNEGEDSFKLQM